MRLHDIVVDQFDGYLRGDASAAFHDHLRDCPECREEVLAMAGVTQLLQELRPGVDVAEPPPGFYNRLTGRIVERQRSEMWGFFAPGVVFFRRMAFASLLVLAALGGFLVSRETSEGGADAAAIIAQHDVSIAHNESSDRDRLLVTLANWHE